MAEFDSNNICRRVRVVQVDEALYGEYRDLRSRINTIRVEDHWSDVVVAIMRVKALHLELFYPGVNTPAGFAFPPIVDIIGLGDDIKGTPPKGSAFALHPLLAPVSESQ